MTWEFNPNCEIYNDKLHTMSDSDLENEYRELMKSRGQGGDAEYSLQMYIDLIKDELTVRNLSVPVVPEDNIIYGYIKQTDTPQSSGLMGYGYDYHTQTMYVKYRSSGKVYPFCNVPYQIYERFEVAESKGKAAAIIKKNFGPDVRKDQHEYRPKQGRLPTL